jgi:hypothetical protein
MIGVSLNFFLFILALAFFFFFLIDKYGDRNVGPRDYKGIQKPIGLKEFNNASIERTFG